MRHHLALALALCWWCVQSIRDATILELSTDRTSPSPCEPVQHDGGNPWRFTLAYERSVGLLHDKEYTLRSSADCLGEEQGQVSVIPKVDPDDPLSKSRAVISVQPVDKHKVLFVCGGQNDTLYCLASVKPPSRDWRPHQLLMALPGLEKNRKLLDLHLGEPNRWIDRLEWTMLVIALCFLATTCHAGYIMIKFVGAKPPDGNSVPRGSAAEGTGEAAAVPHKQGFCPVDISNPFAEFQKAWVNSLSFTIASVALVGVLLSVLVKANGHPWLITLTVLWPVTCGNLLLYYFWMSTCRLQLYVAALSRGICVRGINPVNPSMILRGGCIVLLLATGYTLLSGGDVDEGMKRARQISPLVLNPLTTLLAIGGTVHARSLSQHRTQCPLAIDKMVQLMQQPATGEGQEHPDLTGPGACLARQLVSGTVPIISEQSFCQLCRQDLDPVTEIESSEPLPHGPSFRFMDLAWQGRVVYELCGQSVAILNMPVVLFFFLVLTASSVSFGIVGLTVKPSIRTFEMSANWLGRLHPELSPWQVDYELVLDSSVHWATFLVTLPRRGTGEISMLLPGRQEPVNTSNTSHLTSVAVDGTTYPSYIDIRATGLGRVTNYQMLIVKTYELVIAARMVPISSDGYRHEPRFIKWGEVDGSTFTLPTDVSAVELTLLHKEYTMGIPINASMANSDEGISSDVSTVYQHIENASTHLCRTRCRNEVRCFKSMSGRNGCFFIWTPKRIRPEGFELAAAAFEKVQSNKEREGGCKLGARVCKKRDVIYENSCYEMERQSRNLLNATLRLGEGFTLKGQIVNKRVVRFFEDFGDREVIDNDQPDLTFARGSVLPQVFTYLSGINTTADVSIETDGSQQFTKVRVTVGTFNPSKRQMHLVLHMAILVPDDSYDIDMEMSSGVFTNDSNLTEAFRSWGQTVCDGGGAAEQYDICRGWRRTLTVSWELDKWTATGKSWISLRGNPTIRLKVESVTQDGEQPAQWSIREDCLLDLRKRDTAVVGMIFSQQVYECMIYHCANMTIWEPAGNRTLTSLELAHEALTKFKDIKDVVSTFMHVDKSRVITNLTEFYNKVGLQVKGRRVTVRLPSSKLKFPILSVLEYVTVGISKRGGFIDFVCRRMSTGAKWLRGRFGLKALETSVRVGDRSLTRVLGDCIKDRVKFIKTSPGAARQAPALDAIKLGDSDMLKHILEVTSCCFTLQDGTIQQTTYLEYAVAFGCSDCINTYLSKELCNNRVDLDLLFFNRVTGPNMWDDLKKVDQSMEAVRSRGGLRRLAFSETTLDTGRILSEVRYMSTRGTLRNVTHFSLLSWTATRPEDYPELEERFVQIFCTVVDGMPKLKVLLSGSRLNRIQTIQEYLQCVAKLPHLEYLDLHLPSPDVVPALHNELKKLMPLKQLLVFIPGVNASEPIKVLDELSAKVLPRGTKVEVLAPDAIGWLREKFFTRGECHPKNGTQHEKSWISLDR